MLKKHLAYNFKISSKKITLKAARGGKSKSFSFPLQVESDF